MTRLQKCAPNACLIVYVTLCIYWTPIGHSHTHRPNRLICGHWCCFDLIERNNKRYMLVYGFFFVLKMCYHVECCVRCSRKIAKCIYIYIHVVEFGVPTTTSTATTAATTTTTRTMKATNTWSMVKWQSVCVYITIHSNQLSTQIQTPEPIWNARFRGSFASQIHQITVKETK